MKISDILKPSLIKTDLESADKNGLFEEMVRLFVEQGLLRDGSAALQALREREAKMTTGIANGLALPHGKLRDAKSLLMAVGVSKAGIEYESLDGEPVHVVIMVLAEAGNPGPHIEALAEISRLFALPGFMQRIREAHSAGEILELVRREE